MTNQNSSDTPCAFLSYSWSSPQHQQWVIDLATRLVGDGVDVRLDIWDLKPGHDSYQFMESMITDQNVTKVLMICDKVYATKADTRSGGVGSETQIITPELYGKGTQDKFAALITEEDDEGKVCVPVFYKSRIHFNFVAPERYEESYESLLRWLTNRPLHIKPKLGKIPDSILRNVPVATATISRVKRAEEEIRKGTPGASAYIQEYGDILIAELISFAPNRQNGSPYEETLMSTLEACRPYVRQFTEFLTIAVRFERDDRIWDATLTLLERIGRLMFRSTEVTQWQDADYDLYRIIAHECFLSTIAISISEQRFDLADKAIRRAWLVNINENGNRPTTSIFTVFNPHVETLYQKQQRATPRPISLQADILKQAHPVGGTPSFESLMQADFVLFFLSADNSYGNFWYPFTLVYSYNHYRPFEIFARAESQSYFARLCNLLNEPSVDSFKQKISRLQGSERSKHMFVHRGLAVAALANNDYIGTMS